MCRGLSFGFFLEQMNSAKELIIDNKNNERKPGCQGVLKK